MQEPEVAATNTGEQHYAAEPRTFAPYDGNGEGTTDAGQVEAAGTMHPRPSQSMEDYIMIESYEDQVPRGIARLCESWVAGVDAADEQRAGDNVATYGMPPQSPKRRRVGGKRAKFVLPMLGAVAVAATVAAAVALHLTRLP